MPCICTTCFFFSTPQLHTTFSSSPSMYISTISHAPKIQHRSIGYCHSSSAHEGYRSINSAIRTSRAAPQLSTRRSVTFENADIPDAQVVIFSHAAVPTGLPRHGGYTRTLSQAVARRGDRGRCNRRGTFPLDREITGNSEWTTTQCEGGVCT